MPVLRTSLYLPVPEATTRAALAELDTVDPPRHPAGCTLSAAVTPVGSMSLLVCTADWPARGAVTDFVRGTLLRASVLRTLDRACAAVRRRTEELAAREVVVGAALLSEGRVLAQQRAFPAETAGRWELPGGRVESGETEQDALRRECAEELGVEVVPGNRLGQDVPLGDWLVFRVYTAELAEQGAVPEAKEHRAVRWLTATELDTVDWLGADLDVLPALRALLAVPD